MSEEDFERLDRAWEDFAGDTTGAIRNRQWQRFKQQHPEYIRKEAREQLKAFKKQ